MITYYHINNMQKIVMSKAPIRLSLAGGGSDIICYCSKFGGKVIGFSLDSYVITTIMSKNSFLHKNQTQYFNCQEFKDTSELENPFLMHALNTCEINGNYKMSILSDTPPGSGLGGSAAFLNSVISAAWSLEHESLEKTVLAEKSSSIEINQLKLPVGKQDHYLSALGGVNLLNFKKDLSVEVIPVQVKEKCANYFKNRLLLFYTNISRKASKQLEYQSQKIEENNMKTIQLVDNIKALVEPMYQAILNDRPDEIGMLIKEHWDHKRAVHSGKVDTDINDLFKVCYQNGADGCKILGAGGGGFIVVSVREGMQESIRSVLRTYNMKELEFNIDYTGTIVKHIEF